MTERVDINNLLSTMRAMKSQTQAFGHVDRLEGMGQKPQQVSAANGANFGDLFSKAINNVNEVQKESGAMASAYIRGEGDVDITDVMIASQKSSVAFQALTQVRNKVVEAYKDVMNMPI